MISSGGKTVDKIRRNKRTKFWGTMTLGDQEEEEEIIKETAKIQWNGSWKLDDDSVSRREKCSTLLNATGQSYED